VGDTADGIPGVPRWGQKAAAALLAEYTHREAIPHDDALWRVKIRGSRALAAELATHHTAALLYRELATLRSDVPLVETLDELRYGGPRLAELRAVCEEVADFSLLEGVAPPPS
jgi:5'-3' exonuclease